MNSLYCPPSYTNATSEQREKVCNGCGAANSKFDFVPDTVYGLSITSACNIHDWMYSCGLTHESKLTADRVFLYNMLRIVENKGGWLKRVRRCHVHKYYIAVKMFGGPAFWAGKN